MAAALQDLLGLWRGDEDSCGYAHEGLAYEICRRLRPKDRTVFVNNLYPGCQEEEIQPEYMVIVNSALERWRKERK